MNILIVLVFVLALSGTKFGTEATENHNHQLLEDHSPKLGLSRRADYNIFAISYDWIAENIYYAGDQQNHIGVCNRQGSACTVVVQDVNHVLGMTLDPNRGTMYWCVSHTSAIRKAGVDGSSPVTIVSTNLGRNLRGMTLDYENSRLYWVNRDPHSIHSTNLEGGDRRIVIPLGPFDPMGVDILGDKLYWSERGMKRVRRCNKLNCSDPTTVLNTPSELYLLALLHHDRQPKGRINHCAGKLCSHLCVLTPNNYFRCLCPKELILSEDGATCMAPTKSPPSISYGVHNNDLCPNGAYKPANATATGISIPISVPRYRADSSLFLCRHGEDIPLERSCDGKCDCGDGSDEGKGCNVPCNGPTTGGHGIECRVSPTGPVYTCASGYRWSVAEGSCVVVDEGGEDHSSHPYNCLNLNGIFACNGPSECLDRFDDDIFEQILFLPQLIYVWNGTIRKAPFSVSKRSRMGISIPEPSGMDVNSMTDEIYWSHEKSGQVNRIPVSTGMSNIIPKSQNVISKLPGPTHLAYDWLSNNLYVVTESDKSCEGPVGVSPKLIKLCHVPTNEPDPVCTNLYRTFGPNVTGLAVAPADNYIFWTEVLFNPVTAITKGALRRGRTDILEVVNLVTEEVEFPSGLVVDPSSERVFWLDVGKQRVEAVNFDGSDRVIIVHSGISLKARGLAVLENSIMWSDEGGIFICAITSGTNCLKTTLAKEGAVTMFKILHTSLQNPGVNPCLNSECTHICTGARSVSTEGAYKCYCPEGSLSEDFDQKTCIP